MISLPRKKVAPIPPSSAPEADPDARRRWQLETPLNRVEVLADDCAIKHGVLTFMDAPLGKLNGRRNLVCIYSPSGWRRLIPPPGLDNADEENGGGEAA